MLVVAISKRLFGGDRAQLPEPLPSTVLAEEPMLLEEDLRGTITYRNHRAPGHFSSWAQKATGGAIAVTGHRLVVWITNDEHSNSDRVQGRPTGVAVIVDRPDRISFSYDAGALRTDRRGQVQIRFTALSATRISQMLAG